MSKGSNYGVLEDAGLADSFSEFIASATTKEDLKLLEEAESKGYVYIIVGALFAREDDTVVKIYRRAPDSFNTRSGRIEEAWLASDGQYYSRYGVPFSVTDPNAPRIKKRIIIDEDRVELLARAFKRDPAATEQIDNKIFMNKVKDLIDLLLADTSNEQLKKFAQVISSHDLPDKLYKKGVNLLHTLKFKPHIDLTDKLNAFITEAKTETRETDEKELS